MYMNKPVTYISRNGWLYQVWVEVVEAEAVEAEEEGRLENLALRVFWVGVPGWSFSWGGSVLRVKAPVFPATARSCDPETEAGQHLGGARCRKKRHFYTDVMLALMWITLWKHLSMWIWKWKMWICICFWLTQTLWFRTERRFFCACFKELKCTFL